MCGMHKGRRLVTLASWSALQFGMLKFNVDGVARGKPRFVVVRGGLLFLLLFFNHMGVEDCNKEKVLAILHALWIFLVSFEDMLILDSDSSNVISLVCSLRFNAMEVLVLF